MYAVGQNIYRQTANDPQVQLAEDGAATLNSGGVPAEVVPHGTPIVDIATTLAPWVVVYDASGKPLENTGQLDNAPPTLPTGVFDTTNKSAQVDDPIWINGEYRFTWQPRAGVRQAVVLVQSKQRGYFVAAGRSLRESERRTGILGMNMLFGWLGALVLTLIWSFVVIKLADVFGRGAA